MTRELGISFISKTFYLSPSLPGQPALMAGERICQLYELNMKPPFHSDHTIALA